MEFATMKDMIENVTEYVEYLKPHYNSGERMGCQDYYSCPCCNKSEPVDHSNKRITLDEMNHTDNCIYLLLNNLKNKSEDEEVSKKLDEIILNDDIYEER